MALLIAPILLITAVLYIAYPLLKEESEPEDQMADERNAEDQALQNRSDIIDVLKDIDMDYRMGKLSKHDYETLKGDFENRAVEAFQRLKSFQTRGGQSEKIKS